MPKFANIIVNSRSGNLSGEFTYSVSKDLINHIEIGKLVLVPFGRRVEYGVVAELLSSKPDDKIKTKSIKEIISDRPIVNSSQIILSKFISRYYFCSVGRALFAMIPSFITKSINKIYSINKTGKKLTPRQQEIIDFINVGNNNEKSEKDIIHKFGSSIKNTMSNLEKNKVLKKSYRFAAPKVKAKYEEIISLKDLSGEQLAKVKKYKKQSELYQFLKYRRSSSWSTIKHELKLNRSTLTSLAGKNIISIKKERIVRGPIVLPDQEAAVPDLVGSQRKAWQAIKKELDSKKKKQPIMLFGRTGSGKTELYLRAASQTLNEGKGVIILVPEIALVPQTLQRFYERFGEKLAVFHSQLSAGERYDQWYRIYNGEANIVIGSRSALFTPIKNLGLIIIDEEHEYSYKQDSTPRYHAVKTAAEYAKITNSLLILGSATPRLETFWTAKKGKYQMIKLTKTIAETVDQKIVRRPEFAVVDLRDEFIAGNRSLLSYKLQESIQKALLSKKQILLFLNRRGYTTYVFCRECGYVAKCPECYIPLTLHMRSNLGNRLICHHCGLMTNNLATCPECTSPAIKYYGAGTQKIEEEVRTLFPHAKILRMDFDTTRTRNAHHHIFTAFKNKEADILIGTQMITKGWDLPNVDLIGIVNADGGFNLPDFRATEKNFALLLQLIGRVGRGKTPGRVVLQTYDPENPLLDPLLREDYQLFAFSELIERKKSNFPPFAQIVRLLYESSDINKCKNEAIKLFKTLNEKYVKQKKKTLIEILGPTPAFIAQIKQKHRWHLILKGKNLQAFLDIVPADWTIDVDPYSLL